MRQIVRVHKPGLTAIKVRTSLNEYGKIRRGDLVRVMYLEKQEDEGCPAYVDGTVRMIHQDSDGQPTRRITLAPAKVYNSWGGVRTVDLYDVSLDSPDIACITPLPDTLKTAGIVVIESNEINHEDEEDRHL